MNTSFKLLALICILSISQISCDGISQPNKALSEKAKNDSLNTAAIEMQADLDAKSEPLIIMHENSGEATESKKKMNNTTKGALIGAGIGAASGAVIDKKPVRGAVLGGVVGAGAGAVTGKIIDDKKKE